MNTIRFTTILPIITLLIQISYGQKIIPGEPEESPIFLTKQKNMNLVSSVPPDNIFRFSEKNGWAAAIDSAWGPGLPTGDKLQIFDLFRKNIDSVFACFQNLECTQTLINWDSLADAFREEIQDTVSRGRFAAMMNHLCLALREAHTHATDYTVNLQSGHPAKGLPLLCLGGYGENFHFGAGLTPLPDSTLLVYKVAQDHPLGLSPGDIVLGYEGQLWKDIYPVLIDAELPIAGFWWQGSSESAFLHSCLMGAGLNWHLFDTIDIVKYPDGDTLHLATDPLSNLNWSLRCTEQMDIPGVPKPNYTAQELASYGKIEGTNIGYIYVWSWFWNVEQEFYDAVYDLMYNHQTDGLIIDFRYNLGGNMFLSNEGLSLLFNKQVTTIGFANRYLPEDHCSMVNSTPPSVYVIPGNQGSYYDKPIAVLTGPGAVSSGDQVAYRMTFHPMARIFGKSTTAAFNAPTTLDLGYAGWNCSFAVADAYDVSDPANYLTHEEFPVDEYIWHTREAVADGRDAAVEAAMDWIQGPTFYQERPDKKSNFMLQLCPNPSRDVFSVNFLLKSNIYIDLKIYDLSGRLVSNPVNEFRCTGANSIRFDVSHLKEGCYICILQTPEGSEKIKLILCN